jgi:2-phosphosulfolactate phosphatase
MLGSVLREIHLAVLPSEPLGTGDGCCFVVDVLRATTTIATLFGAGVGSLIAFDDIDAARRAADGGQRLLFGEVNGLPPAGFDSGNSPVDAAAMELQDRDVALFTTNGTRALAIAAEHGPVFAGSLVNASAIARAATAFERVTVVCAGGRGGTRFGLDDFACAARIVYRLSQAAPGVTLGDAARLGVDLGASPEWVARSIGTSHHAGVLRRVGLDADITFALEEDRYDVAPCGRLTVPGAVTFA